MSINSLTSNPTILNELLNKVSEAIPTTTIKTLSNDDGNVDVSVLNFVGTVNLSANLNLNSTESNEIRAPSITSANETLTIQTDPQDDYSEIIIGTDYTAISTNSDLNGLLLEQGSVTLTDNVNLKLNNMDNPFSQDGTNGQLLGTDGNNNIQFYNPVSTNKNIYNFYQNFNSGSGAGTLILYFNPIIPNFTVGKKSIVEIAFSFYQDGTTAPFNINVTLGSISQTIQAFSELVLTHIPYKVIFQIENTAITQSLNISLQTSPPSSPQLYLVDPGDYISINIYEF